METKILQTKLTEAKTENSYSGQVKPTKTKAKVLYSELTTLAEVELKALLSEPTGLTVTELRARSTVAGPEPCLKLKDLATNPAETHMALRLEPTKLEAKISGETIGGGDNKASPDPRPG